MTNDQLASEGKHDARKDNFSPIYVDFDLIMVYMRIVQLKSNLTQWVPNQSKLCEAYTVYFLLTMSESYWFDPVVIFEDILYGIVVTDC